MPARLSSVQRAALLAAGKTGKGMIRVRPHTGDALQARGLGYYHQVPDSIFYLNGAGLNVVLAIEKGSSWNDIEKRSQ